MAMDTRHPLYAERSADWIQMRDTYGGERVVKAAGTRYLPATSGMIADGIQRSGQPGYDAYQAYRTRARYPDMVKDAVEALLGVMHHKPPTIELPEAMEPMRELATLRNESLEMLLRRINEEQLVTGRVGLLADVIDRGLREGQAYFSVYCGESIINWDEGSRDGIEPQSLNLVVLDETESERSDDFEWEEVEKYRVLVLGNPFMNEQAGEGVYRVGTFRADAEGGLAFSEAALVTPSIAGNQLMEIPFDFANSKDVTPEPDSPPLLGLSNLSLLIYRGEADYRQSLFMQGQDTLVLLGVAEDDAVIRTGAGASIKIGNPQGDAKYIGVDSGGLEEQRQALQNDYNRGAQKSGELLDSVSRERESGEALRVRVAARTATLHQIALTGAFTLQSGLRRVARWMGLDESQVIVAANQDFADDQMTGQALMEYVTAKIQGAPISYRTIHSIMEDRGVTKFNFEDELSEIESEDPLVLGSSNEDGPEDDPVDDDEE